MPSSLTLLREVLASGRIGPAPISGFAVTPALREWYLDNDIEALEYAALNEAGRASLRLIAQTQAPARRVVLACEIDDTLATPTRDGGRGAVAVALEVSMDRIESAQVDTPDAVADVAAAIAALPAAAAGDDEAQFVVDSVEDHELAWFARQEFADLLA